MAFRGVQGAIKLTAAFGCAHAACLLMEGLPSCQEAVQAGLDLLLRWVALRMADANMQSSLKILEFTRHLLVQLTGQVCRLEHATSSQCDWQSHGLSCRQVHDSIAMQIASAFENLGSV